MLHVKILYELPSSRILRSEFSGMKGFSPQNIKYMRKFSEEYNLKEFGQQAVDQIPSNLKTALPTIEELETELAKDLKTEETDE